MSDQEVRFYQQLQDEDSICRSMNHLTTTAAAALRHHLAATTSPEKLSSKRQSPLSPSSFQEPLPKRATLHPPSPPSATTAAGDYDAHLFGFTRLPLPHPFPATSPSPLRRTLSEPIRPDDVAAPPPQLPEIPYSPNPNLNLPFPHIHRTVSDPNPVANYQAAGGGGGTPPARPTPARSPSCGESPSTKRLKRMKERLKEMSQWWNQVVCEGEAEDEDEEAAEEENNETQNYCTQIIPKEESETEIENPSQEAVWVEKNGDCLVIHFKCPCGTGYQILLSGNNCYYKLTNF